MPSEIKIPATTYVRIAIIAGAATYSAYQLGKLGVDWSREGIRTLKSKKNAK